MIRDWQNVIQWISLNIEAAMMEKEEYSLWRALYDYGVREIGPSLPVPPPSAAPAVVYISGKAEALQRIGGLLRLIDPDLEGAYLSYRTSPATNREWTGNAATGQPQVRQAAHPSWSYYESSEPFLLYLTVCYISPAVLNRYGDSIGKVTLVTSGRPEMWMKPLLEQRKVCGLVGWERSIDPAWEVNWSSSHQAFEWSKLLNNYATAKAVREVAGSRANPKLPFGLKMGLQRALAERDETKRGQLWRQTLDSAAARLLDEKWLNDPGPVPVILPALMQQVRKYLTEVACLPAMASNLEVAVSGMAGWSKEGHKPC
jgi:hypothetical protein